MQRNFRAWCESTQLLTSGYTQILAVESEKLVGRADGMAECGSSSKPTDFHIRGALQSDIDFLVKCMLDAERGPFQRCYWDIAFGNAASSCTAEMFKIPNNGTLFSCECWLVAESFGLHHKRYALLYKIIEQKKLLGAICFHPEGTKTDFVFPPMIEAAKRDCNLSEAELTERLAKANTIDRVLAKIPQGTDTLVVGRSCFFSRHCFRSTPQFRVYVCH